VREFVIAAAVGASPGSVASRAADGLAERQSTAVAPKRPNTSAAIANAFFIESFGVQVLPMLAQAVQGAGASTCLPCRAPVSRRRSPRRRCTRAKERGR
jgi:hypothetical protein